MDFYQLLNMDFSQQGFGAGFGAVTERFSSRMEKTRIEIGCKAEMGKVGLMMSVIAIFHQRDMLLSSIPAP